MSKPVTPKSCGFSCSECGLRNCFHKDTKYPAFCLTERFADAAAKTKRLYGSDGVDAKLARAAAEIEGEYYGRLTRLEETIRFAQKLGVKKPEVKITEKDIDGVLENLASSFAEKKVTKRAAKLTDEVVIDFVGKKDGKAFEGGSAKDYKLALGSKTFIPGFEEGIVGHEPGDKFNLELTFPKDYGMKDLAGAKTVFEVLLKQVNEVVKPEINDELAKKCGPFDGLKALKADIKKNLEMQAEHQNLEKYKNDLVEALVKKSTVTAPEILIDDQMRMMREDLNRNAESMGMGFEQYLERAGETLESWEKKAREVAGERVKGSLVLQNLAIAEKITVSDDLVAAKIAELKDVYKKSPEALKSLKDPNVKMDIRNRMVIEKTLDYLVKVNK